MSAALRLDRFSGPTPARQSVFNAAEIERSFQHGYEQGLHEGREASLDALSSQLAELAQSLRLSDTEARRIRQTTLTEMAPVLTTIIDLLAPQASRTWLLSKISEELVRFADSQSASVLQVKCAPDLRDDLQDCILRAGITTATIHDRPSDDGSVQLAIEGGSITFDPAKAVSDLKTIVEEITNEE